VVVEQDFHKMGDEGHFLIEIGNLTILNGAFGDYSSDKGWMPVKSTRARSNCFSTSFF
jgi:hypothetical protein